MSNKKMLSIYVCGPHGNVGWVSGFGSGDGEILDIRLSLDPADAYTFPNSLPVDPRALAISKFIRRNRKKYGVGHCFMW